MSEYIEIETEPSEDGKKIVFYTNLRLAEGAAEQYDSRDSLERGSPVAQALTTIDGIAFFAHRRFGYDHHKGARCRMVLYR